jgi:hypothetical protein
MYRQGLRSVSHDICIFVGEELSEFGQNNGRSWFPYELERCERAVFRIQALTKLADSARESLQALLPGLFAGAVARLGDGELNLD